MIRLYIDQDFLVGKAISLPEDEWHYFKKVRRGQGEVVLFNRRGQLAKGHVLDRIFEIKEVLINPFSVFPVTVAVGLPDQKVIPEIIQAVSELGVSRLLFFKAARSQSYAKRSEQIDRWNRVALESARQCERSSPLEIVVGESWKMSAQDVDEIFFMDEQSSSSKSFFEISQHKKREASVLVVVGCEGGWTAEERHDALTYPNVQGLHLNLPILRVLTAVTAGSLLALQRSTNDWLMQRFVDPS